MFTRNIKDTFTQGLLNAVSGVLGEAKKKQCAEGCECEACVPEEDTNEGYVSHAQRKAVWANRADDGKGHPDKKKKMKEEAGVGKLGALLKRERDAKEKKEPNGVKTEEVQELDETAKIVAHLQKRYGDNIRKSHVMSAAKDFGVDSSKLAKAVRTKLGKNMLDEESHDDVPFKGPYRKAGERKDEYGNKVKNVAKHLAKKAMNAQKNEEVELDELDEAGLWANIHAKRKRIKAGSGERMRKVGEKGAPTPAGIKSAANEEMSIDDSFEQIDELSKGTMGRYINKAADRMSTQGVTAGLKIAADEKSKKNFDTIAKRQKGIATAVKKLTKEEQDFIDSLNNEMWEEIALAELSDALLKSYSKKALDQSKTLTGDKKVKRQVGARNAIDRLGNNTLAKEEVDLEEGRGRPRKAGAKDFTIHPKTKEKLMHDNPEHMKKIEALQRNGVIPVQKIEANQHVMQQLQRAKLSMRGGETVNFTHGDSHHVSGEHAAKLLTKYAGMKPNEKEAFQKKIGHSHANLKSEL